ncbi:SGNH/GDSL hydrolase family protein [bacterium]|nr:SGNH/GDSL hydrolase family protein [bacterium]
MKKFKRIDEIRSVKALLCALISIFLLFASAEFILQNFTTFGDTLNNLEYYASLAFSDEDLKVAIKAREDLASIGEKVIAVPGTKIYRYKKVRTESFNFNSFGFRGEEPEKKAENEYRIGVFGDSRVLGIYLAEENTMPYILQKRLQEEFPDKKITVYNLGVEGNDLQRAIDFAEFDGEKLELDMAVFYSGVNDINYSFINDKYMGEWDNFEAEDAVYQNLIENIAEHQQKSFIQKSTLISAIQEAFLSDFVKYSSSFSKEEVFSPLLPEYEKRADAFVKTFNERIKKASGDLAEKGIRSVFFFPPVLQLKEPLSASEQNMFYKNEMNVAGFNNYFLRCAKGFSESEDPVLFLQTTIFNGYSKTMLYDGIHFTPEASRIAGNNMADRIIPLLKKSEEKLK